MLPSSGTSPIHASTLPRNIKPTQSSLNRKSSLPIPPKNHVPPLHAMRKAPPPPPRPLPRQSTVPLIGSQASSLESDTKSEPTKPKPPKCPPRRKSFGENSKTEKVDTKVTSAQRSLSPPLPPAPCPTNKQEDSETSADSEALSDLPSPPSETEAKTNNRMSLEDDVFPPPPPEHLLTSLKPVSQNEQQSKQMIKPPRPSLLKGDASRSSNEASELTVILKQRNIIKEEAPSEERKQEETVSQGQAGSSARIGSPGHTGSPEHTGSPGHGSPAHTGSPGQAGPPGPPVTKPKPPVKRKPQLPPKPPKPTPGGGLKKDGSEERDDSTAQGVDQNSSLNVVQVPRKRPSHSLSDLVERRLRIEQIDLTELPYSTLVSPFTC